MTTYQEDEDHDRAYERAEMTKANKKFSRMHSWRSFLPRAFRLCASCSFGSLLIIQAEPK